jgi:hypothetical protein
VTARDASPGEYGCFAIQCIAKQPVGNDRRNDPTPARSRPTLHVFGGKEHPMKEAIDHRAEGMSNRLDQERTEERFLEQFAALEENLTLLQASMHSMSETAKLFGSLARHIRRSNCPASGRQDKIRADCGLGQR